MGRRRSYVDMDLEELTKQRLEPTDLSMEQLSQVQVEEQPERRLGAMSMEQLGQVETLPGRGEVLRGRVGKGGDPLSDKLPEELSQIQVAQDQPPDMSAAKEATARGQVLRGSVGGDLGRISQVGKDPRDTARRLRDIVEPQIPDEMIEKDFMEQSSKGVSPDDQVKANVDEAKQVTMMKFAQRQQQARQQYQDEVNRARAEQENVHWLETTLRGIADAAAAYAGQGARVYSGPAEEARSKRAQQRERAAKETYAGELESISADQASADAADQAAMIAQQLRGAGIMIPEGAEQKNPKAFVEVYGKLVGKSAGGDGMSPSLAYRIGRDEKLDERHAMERREEREWRTQDRAQAVQDTRDTAEINRQAQVEQDKRKQVQEIEGFASEVESNIRLLEDQIRDKGTYEMMGSHNADLERRITNIATALAKLADPGSVAREGEVSLARKGIFEPGLGVRNQTAIEVLGNLRKELEDRKARAYQVRGLEAPSAHQPQTSAPEANIDDLLEKYR